MVIARNNFVTLIGRSFPNCGKITVRAHLTPLNMSPVEDPKPNPEGRADFTSLSIAAKGSSSSGCGAGDPSGPDGDSPKNEGREILLDEHLPELSLI